MDIFIEKWYIANSNAGKISAVDNIIMKTRIEVVLLGRTGRDGPIVYAMAGEKKEGVILHRDVKVVPKQEGSEEFEGQTLNACYNRDKKRWEVGHPLVAKRRYHIIELQNGVPISMGYRDIASIEKLVEALKLIPSAIGAHWHRTVSGSLVDIWVLEMVDCEISTSAELEAALKKAKKCLNP